jgi:Domain of unknown function (DUF5107)
MLPVGKKMMRHTLRAVYISAMKNIGCFIFFLAGCVPFTGYTQTPSATIKEYRQTFTTYPFSDPDPVAKTGRIYPYFRYDGFTDQAVQREWKVVELENEWLRVLILPEIGGKIWTAIEKSTGKAFIYYNHVVKFRDIAMRGPWTSGGIEANYGVIGHTPACAVPVNYLTRQNPDGSASCIISTLDLLTQTRWTLDVNLPADKAYFATRSFWHNSMPIDQPYYTWMNVGLKAAGNLEFTYPGLQRLGHEGETGPWPIDDQGRDLRRYEQNNFGSYKSYHVFGQYSTFFGGYWHDEQFGMGRYATRDDKPGKKIWIWGLSRQGMIWDKLLTDTDGQYVEVQSGRLFNQSAPGSVHSPFKYRSFAPYATDTWTEYWFPTLRTGGAVEANTYGTLNATADKGQLNLAFCALQPIEAAVHVFADGQLYFTEKIKLKTLETWRVARPYGGPIEKIRIEIGDHLLEWDGSPEPGALQRPTAAPADFNRNSAYAFYLRAKAWDEQREYDQAGPLYDSALVREPYLLPALTGKSQLCYRNMQYEMAAALAQKALSVDTYDPAANYCWGLANVALGYTADAKDGFEIASQSVAYRAAAFTELAKCYARTRDRAKMAHYAQKALETNADNITALQLLVMAARPGTPLQPEQLHIQDDLLTRLRQHDPFNISALVETLTTTNALTKELLLQHAPAFNHDELPHEKYLAAAAWYADLRDTAAALTALGLSPACPEKHYRAAWLGQTPDANLAEALRLSPALVFPSRSDLKPALEWALQQQPHWKTRYYLGLLHLCRADTTTALKYWSDCADEPDFAPFYLARAAVLEPSDPAAAEKDLRRALALDPQQWRADLALSKFLRRQKQFAASLVVAEAAFKKHRGHYIPGLEYAQALLYNGGYKTCIALLDTLHVLPYEGAQDARLMFRTACLMAALETSDLFAAEDLAEKAQSWPENLGSGKPYLADIDQRVEYYVAAQIQGRQGKEREANELYELAAQPAPDRALNSGEYASVLALRHLGRLDEARMRMQNWVDTRPDDPVARWSAATFAFPRANDLPLQAIYLKDLNGLIYSQFVR